MIRIGPARNTNAGAAAAVLSCAGIVMLMFGFFFLVPGITLTATAKSGFDDDVNEGQQAAGIALLVLGLILITGGTICCVCMCQKANEATRAQANQPQATVVGGPVVTGTVPVGQQYGVTQPAYGGGVQPAFAPQTFPSAGGQYPPPTNPAYSTSQNYSSEGTILAPPPPSYNAVVASEKQ